MHKNYYCPTIYKSAKCWPSLSARVPGFAVCALKRSQVYQSTVDRRFTTALTVDDTSNDWIGERAAETQHQQVRARSVHRMAAAALRRVATVLRDVTSLAQSRRH